MSAGTAVGLHTHRCSSSTADEACAKAHCGVESPHLDLPEMAVVTQAVLQRKPRAICKCRCQQCIGFFV